jgi:hypothetical protein
MKMNVHVEKWMNLLSEQIIDACASKYGFDGEEAKKEMCVNVCREVKEKKLNKKEKKIRSEMPEIPFPFSGVIIEDRCEGVKPTYGLFSQCMNERGANGRCKGCVKNDSIQNRVSQGENYKDAKGRSPIAYTKVMAKLKLSREDVMMEACKFNVVVNEDHFKVVEKQKKVKEVKESKGDKKRGRPKKNEKLMEVDSNEDLFAGLVAEAEADAVRSSENDDSSGSDSESDSDEEDESSFDKKAVLEAEKVEKKAALEAEKAEKKALKEAEKAEKKALKEAEKAEKAEKKALKEASKAEKAEKKASKEEKKASKEEKAEKKASKEEKKASKAEKKASKEEKAEKEASKENKMKTIIYKDVAYSVDKSTNKVFDMETNKEVGKWYEEILLVDFHMEKKEEEETSSVSGSDEEEEEEAEAVPEKEVEKVRKLEYKGKTYLRSIISNIVFDIESQDEIGVWSESRGEIDFSELEEELEDLEDDE